MAINKTTFTKELLEELMRGIAKTSIAPVADGAVTFSSTTFSNAGRLYSVEGSLNLDWPEPTLEEIRIDQGLQTIAMDVDKGDISFSANYPAMAADVLKEFFKHTESDVTLVSPDGVSYVGPGLFVEPQTTEVSVLIEDMNEQYAIAMARVALTARLAYDTDRKLWYLGLNGRVLANLAANQPDAVAGKKQTQGGG